MPAFLVQRDLKGLSLADQAANCRPELLGAFVASIVLARLRRITEEAGRRCVGRGGRSARLLTLPLARLVLPNQQGGMDIRKP